MELDFIGGGYKGRSLAVNGQECVNFYPEIYAATEKSKQPMVLMPTPGLKLFIDGAADSAIRGMYTSSVGRAFYVSGNKLYEATTTGGKILRGTLNLANTTLVGFADNGDDPTAGRGLLIIDGLYGYMLNLNTNTFAQIPDTNFKACTHCFFLDGRFFINETNSQRFWWSGLYDGMTWDGLNFATAEGTPDNLKAITTINNEIWLIGEQSTEVWYDSGDATNPFQRIHGAFFNNGTIAPNSIATNGSNVFWLGSSAQGHGQVWTATNYQPQKISTVCIDNLIESMESIEDAIGFCYTQEGHNFYLLSFPTGNRTLCYDISTGFWHERGYWNGKDGTMQRHKAIATCFFNGKNYAGDCVNGNIYEISLDTFTDNDDVVRRIRTGGHVHSDRQRLFFNEFEVDIQRGIGLQSGQGDDPQAFLQWSDDGGFTWSNEYWGSFGMVGRYQTRMHWHRLGMSRDRVFRLTTSDPNKIILISARADITKEA